MMLAEIFDITTVGYKKMTWAETFDMITVGHFILLSSYLTLSSELIETQAMIEEWNQMWARNEAIIFNFLTKLHGLTL